MKILIVAGGTGGHFYPGLAVARALLEKKHSVLFLVRTGDVVIPLLDREKIPFRTIAGAGFKRALHPKNIGAVLKLFLGFVQSLLIVLSERPERLLVMGGYLSVPPAMAARIFSIPIFLHEQNVLPGLANRLLSRLAKRVFISFEASQKVFSSAVVVTGNPVRRELGDLPSQEESREQLALDSGKKTLLVFGGSLGAHRINQLVTDALKALSTHANHWQVLHFTGSADEAEIKRVYSTLPFQSQVAAYCHEMPSAYSAADLVVCRAGAGTISELIVVRKPAILIPYPLASENHQVANAKVLSDVGAAELHEEKNLEINLMQEILEGYFSENAALEARVRAYDAVKQRPLKAASIIAAAVVEN